MVDLRNGLLKLFRSKILTEINKQQARTPAELIRKLSHWIYLQFSMRLRENQAISD